MAANAWSDGVAVVASTAEGSPDIRHRRGRFVTKGFERALLPSTQVGDRLTALRGNLRDVGPRLLYGSAPALQHL